MGYAPSDEQQAAIDFALTMPESTCMYIDGGAGTGKSFTIDEICKRLPNVLKCAPSGTAANNIGGVTIQKLFCLGWMAFQNFPIKVFDPEWTYSNYRRAMFGKAGKMAGAFFNKKLLEPLEFCSAIIIDEAGNTSCNLVDAADVILRGVRKEPQKPFGGCRMIFSGDLGQLAPVIKDDVKQELLAFGYKEPFNFLNAKVFSDES